MMLHEAFVLEILRQFDQVLTRDLGFKLIRLDFTPEVDDDYKIEYQRMNPVEVIISFQLSQNAENGNLPLRKGIGVVVSRAKPGFLGKIMAEAEGYGVRGKDYFFLDLSQYEDTNSQNVHMNLKDWVLIIRNNLFEEFKDVLNFHST